MDEQRACVGVVRGDIYACMGIIAGGAYLEQADSVCESMCGRADADV